MRSVILATAMGLTVLGSAARADLPAGTLSAAESDPRAMGWMQGFPPPPEKQITQPDSVYFSFPRLRWSVCHLREFLPTEEISRGLGAPRPFAGAGARGPERQHGGDRRAQLSAHGR